LIYLVAQGWLITAVRASPVRGFKRSVTRKASFHPSLGREAIWASTAFSQSVLDRTSKSRSVTFRIQEE
jgi:hypothetical protein